MTFQVCFYSSVVLFGSTDKVLTHFYVFHVVIITNKYQNKKCLLIGVCTHWAAATAAVVAVVVIDCCVLVSAISNE